jgi:putative ABC transport system permease protein
LIPVTTREQRLAHVVLRFVLPEEDAEAITGDLEETLTLAIAPRCGVRRAALWYWRQVFSIVWAHLRQAAADAISPPPKRMTMPIRQDLIFGWRALRQRPSFTLVAVLMLAVGIGSTVAIFSLVNALMLKPLPFSEPERLMLVHMLMPDRDAPGVFRQVFWSYPKYLRLRDGQRSFQSTALFTDREYNLTGSRSPARVSIELVEHTYFNLLGVAPQIGRTFTADETRAPGSEPLAVLGYGFWVSRFAGDASVVGRTVGLNGVPHTIVGVMPRGFSGLSARAQVWTPITTIPASDLEEPFSHSYRTVARRAENVSIGEAQAEVRLLGERIDQHFSDSLTTARWGAVAIPLNDQRIDPLVRRSVLLLLAAVGSVLLIVCVNLANLTLVRALARQREVAIRLALGASRLRIIRQLMTENLMLAALGTVAGLFVAYGATTAGAALLPEAGMVLPRGPSIGLTRLGLDHLGLDAATIIFTLLTGVATAVLFGLGPAWRTSRRDLTAVMKAGSSGAVSRVTGSALRNLLLVGEMALALVLLTAGGLMLTSVMRLQATSLGFEPRSLLTAGLSLPDPQYEPARATQLFEQLLSRLAAQPGIESIAYGSCAPVSDGCNGTLATFPGRPPLPNERRPFIGVRWASPRYFETMKIRLVRGRLFNERDRVGQPKVVVINETAARAFWPNDDPIGKRIGVGQGGFRDGAEVVGIVADVRYGAMETAITPDVYLPLLASPRSSGIIYARSSLAPASLAPTLRRELEALDPDLPMTDVRLMEQRLGDAIWRPRMSAWLLGAFSIIALFLAALGIYGVMSQAVEQRTREIGVRMALGAARGDILRMIIRRVVILALAGVTTGVLVAIPAMRTLSTLLYQVKPGDPFVFGTLAAVLLAVAVFAGYVPARRAARLDPLVTLRAE